MNDEKNEIEVSNHSLYYAHSLPEKPKSDWQLLEDHLKNVSYRAKLFAESFNSGSWGYIAGLWHDLGKYSKEFQAKLLLENGEDTHIEVKSRVDHSTAGAKNAIRVLNKHIGKVIAYIIAGHHAGLPNGNNNETSDLAHRLDDQNIIPKWDNCPANLLTALKPNDFALPIKIDEKRAGFQISFFIRMLYSCLTDADFLDTEEFMDPEKSMWRKGYPKLDDLYSRLKDELDKIIKNAEPSKINLYRKSILDKCVQEAFNDQGFFSLTVPTGGGKTLSSLAFALTHAIHHGLRRIIYVIPYTSIIEQNAKVFRNILGNSVVLEHHSNYIPEIEDHRSRLLCENWDAPLIVTTNVQFFESLYSYRSSHCRKLHNIARSVVILDEAQMLPVDLLKPCLESLKELVHSYKTTVLICTATQPALTKSETFKDGIDDVYEIIDDCKRLYSELQRTDVEYLSTVLDNDLVDRLKGHRQVLCIVNTRKHARKIYEMMKQHGNVYHLSALMCPVDRNKIIEKIHKVLKNKEDCRLISTQLIEAGVDIDFPVVYRSMAGIDSIAQAAGRCNREGKLAGKGKVYVFKPENGLPDGHIKLTAQTAEGVMRRNNDPLSLKAIYEYFQTLYWTKGELLDKKQILVELNNNPYDLNFPFREVAKKFRLIEDIMESIIIPRDEKVKGLLQKLEYCDKPNKIIRKLQPYTIQIYSNQFQELLRNGALKVIRDQFYVLENEDIYKDDVGLCIDNPFYKNEESLVC